MVATASTASLLEVAICALTQRWPVSPEEASAAITEVAEELDLEMADLAALLAAAEQQRRLQERSWSLRQSVSTSWAMRRPSPELTAEHRTPLSSAS